MGDSYKYYLDLIKSLTSVDELYNIMRDITYFFQDDMDKMSELISIINARVKAIRNKDRTDALLKTSDISIGWIQTDPYSNKEKYKKVMQDFILWFDNLDEVVDKLYQTLSSHVSLLGDGVIVVDLRETVAILDRFNYIPDINLGALVVRNGVIDCLREYIKSSLLKELNKSIPYTEDQRTFYINSINMYFYHEPDGSKAKDDDCLFHALKIYNKQDIEILREWYNEPKGPIPINKAEDIVSYLKLSGIVPITCNLTTDRRQALYNDIVLENDHYEVVTHGWKPIKIPEIDSFRYIITHYDIETFRKPYNNNISEFAFCVAGLSITDEKDSTLIDFYYITNLIDVLNISVNVAIKQGIDHVYLNAYNGRAFDHYMLLEQSIDLINITRYTNKKNQILRVDFIYNNITFIMWDLNKIIDGSLDYNMQYLLGISKITFNKYDELCHWDYMSHDLRQELINYLYIDTIGLRNLYIKLNQTFRELGYHDIVRYISTSQMTFNTYLVKYYKPEESPIMIPPLNIDNAIRCSCYGGRSHPVRQEFISSDNKDDVIVARDIVSLYPAALCEDYPSGTPQIYCYKDKDIISKIESGEYLAICFVAFDADYCPLLEPILPKKSNTGHLIWDFKHGEGWYTSVSINIARAYGYRFTMQNGYYWKHKTKLFKKYIETLYNIRIKYPKTHPLNLMAKLLMNGFYGKLIQKPISTKIKICNTSIETHREIHRAVVNRGIIKRYNIGTKVFLEIDYKLRNKDIIKPSHYGAFCLDYSKKIVMKYMLEYNSLREQNKLFYYINTDCIFIHKSQIPSHHNSTILGGMKDEYNAGIIRAIYISPKIYYLLLSNGEEVMHMKGIDVKQSKITRSHYEELLAGRDIEVNVPYQITKNMLPKNRSDGNNVRAFTLYYHDNVKKIISPKTWDCRSLDNGFYTPSRNTQ